MKPFQRLLPALIFLLFLQFTFAQPKTEKATFAGGCYWCMEEAFDEMEGVISATSGFTGGSHMEAVEILYDPEKITYEKLLEEFWKNIDPTDSGGQFCDRGPRYRSGIFYHDEQQKTLAGKSKSEMEQLLKKTVATTIDPAAEFFPAEASEQDFYKKNALRYKQYRIRCGRDRRLREIWGKK